MNYTKVSMEEILRWLKNNLNDERYEHSLGVADSAKILAKKYNLDEEKAYLAGLLHDCAKCFSKERLLDIVNKNFDIDESEKMNYKTLHAPASAYIAQTEFGVNDNEILSSIRWHTIGNLSMTDFEKIIFLADKIEERTREEEYAGSIREELNKENGLNRALLECYKKTIISLVDRNLTICPLTIDIYNELQRVVNVK